MAEALAEALEGAGAEEPIQAAPYLRQRWRDASYVPVTPGPDMQGLDLDLGRCAAFAVALLHNCRIATESLSDAASIRFEPEDAKQ